jgi:polysaccharide biosynthesis protein PelE
MAADAKTNDLAVTGLSSALGSREATAAALALAGEAIVVFLAFSANITMLAPVALHFVVAIATAAVLFSGREQAADLTIACMIFLVILVAGPAGALAAMAVVPFAGGRPQRPDILQAWYTRLSSAAGADPVTALYDRVVAGRVQTASEQSPQDFEDVIANGPLAARQAALGLIARKFHTDYAPALEAALRSPEPVVRVQAAAVVARVRADLKARIKVLLATEPSPSNRTAVSAATELLRLSACAFVDRADADRSRTSADRLLTSALGTRGDVTRISAMARTQSAPVVERFLISAGRFQDFRVSRRLHTLAARRRYTVRRLLPREADA